MQHLFFDTSALVKRYYDESGTEVVDKLIEREETKVLLTSIAVIETVSAFRRKYNRNDIPEKVVDELLTTFFNEALSNFLIVSTEEALFTHSFDLILEDDLRTLDSLQLSAALAVSEEVEDIAFVSADQELVSVASERGLEAINPDTDDVDMVVDDALFLDEYFEESNQLFRIFENGEIDVREEYEDVPWQEQILIRLIGQRYAYELEKIDSPTLPLDYFYGQIDVEDSKIKTYITRLGDDGIAKNDKKNGGWEIVPDNLPKALSWVEGTDIEDS